MRKKDNTISPAETSQREHGTREPPEGEEASGDRREPETPQKGGAVPARDAKAEAMGAWGSFLIKLALTVTALWAVFHFVLGVTLVSGEAMYPKLRDGDLLLYYRIQKEYNVGDVVAFQHEGKTSVARIGAMGGDVVDISEGSELLVNGTAETDEIFFPTEGNFRGVQFPYTVPDGSCFLLCDYRTAAQDSRDYGAVSMEDFLGKVVGVFRRREI